MIFDVAFGDCYYGKEDRDDKNNNDSIDDNLFTCFLCSVQILKKPANQTRLQLPEILHFRVREPLIGFFHSNFIFLVSKIGTFGKSGHFRTKKNGTSSGQIKILRPLL